MAPLFEGSAAFNQLSPKHNQLTSGAVSGVRCVSRSHGFRQQFSASSSQSAFFLSNSLCCCRRPFFSDCGGCLISGRPSFYRGLRYVSRHPFFFLNLPFWLGVETQFVFRAFSRIASHCDNTTSYCKNPACLHTTHGYSLLTRPLLSVLDQHLPSCDFNPNSAVLPPEFIGAAYRFY